MCCHFCEPGDPLLTELDCGAMAAGGNSKMARIRNMKTMIARVRMDESPLINDDNDEDFEIGGGDDCERKVRKRKRRSLISSK